MSDNSGERTPIPANLRRRVLVEAGHRCAIPTCRYIEVELHHILPWASCKAHRYENLIALCPNCHVRADRGEIDRKSLLLYKSNLRFLHDKYSQLEVDVMFELYKNRNIEKLPWLRFNMILLKRLQESGFISTSNSEKLVSISGVDYSPIFLSLTDKGVGFVEEIGLHEL